MPFRVNEQSNVSIISIQGKFLGSVEGPALKQAVEDLRDAGRTYVIVDLSEADFMDSTGIGTLISALTTMRKAGGDVRLAALRKRIKGVFLMTRLLGGVFEDYETVEDAADSFETNPPVQASEEEA